MTSPAAPWWDREVHADRRPFLEVRGKILRATRAWFEERDFVEVDPAALQRAPGGETHLHAFETRIVDPAGAPRPIYLHTSPEFACKKLLAAGERRIFSLGKVWRNREGGPLHHPEFTMLEWYRAEARYEALMDDCADLLALAAEAAGTRRLEFRGRSVDPFAPPERLSVAEAFQRFAGVDLMAGLAADGTGDRDALAAVAGVRVAADDTWSDIFSKVLVEKVEPRLGDGRAVVLFDYPASQAALARRSPADPRVAERFELYACGVELANAFGELTDPLEQARRLEAEMDEKARLYGERWPIDAGFIDALGAMPEASGAALGFDRLVMLASGAQRIDQVIWTPVE